MTKIQVNSQGKAYLTSGNKVLVSNNGGGSAVIEELNITPTTSAQTITAPSGTDGYSPINVSAVTSSIDANIQAGNIKNGVTILGVTGDYTGSGSATLITKSITQNGTYNASSDNADGYSSVTVNVSGGGGYSELPSYQVSNGVASKRSGALTGNEFSGIMSVGTSALSHAFEGCSGLTGDLDLSSLTSIGNFGLYYAFYGCIGLTSVDLSSLTSVSGDGLSYAFYGCYSLTGALDLSSLTSIGDNGLVDAFYECEGLESVDLSSLTSIGNSGLNYAFFACISLTSVDLSSLTTVGNYGLSYAFQGCHTLTSVDLSSLTTVGNYGLQHAFEYCEPLDGALDLSSLTTVGNSGLQYAFAEIGGLTSVNLSSLTSIDNSGLNYAFEHCGSLSGTIDLSSLTTVGSEGLAGAFTSTYIEHIYFRALTSDSFADDTVFDGMLESVSDATVHFPSNLQSVIGSWSSVTSGFDGMNTTVLFDLTATE